MVNANETAIFTPDEIAAARRYPLVIRWSEEDDLFLVSLPDFGGVTGHGRTAAEAAERGVEMAAEWIDSYRQLGQPIPAPGEVREMVTR
jgi:predicted RNase H-like HicB family nuclease